jgi:hypothetical protein
MFWQGGLEHNQTSPSKQLKEGGQPSFLNIDNLPPNK